MEQRLWLGFIIGMSALVLSGIIALYASATAGSLLAFSSITSLVGVFVYGSRQKRNYPEESREIDNHAENDGEKKGGVSG